jgi:hypothetical protein
MGRRRRRWYRFEKCDNLRLFVKKTEMVAQAVNIYDELAELLANMDPAKVIQFHASKKSQKRLEELLEKNKEGVLNEEEKIEIERFMAVEHIVRLAKARAYQRLAVAP